MQVDSVQLSRKNLVDNPDYKMDYKITAEYEPCAETDAEQEPFTLRKSIHGSRNPSGNNPSIRKLSFHTDDSSHDEYEMDDSIISELHASAKDLADSLIPITPEMNRFFI